MTFHGEASLMNGFVDCRLRFLGVEHPPLLLRRLPRGLRGVIETREEYPARGTGSGVVGGIPEDRGSHEGYAKGEV